MHSSAEMAIDVGASDISVKEKRVQKSFLKGEKIPVGAETTNHLLMVVLDEMRGARQNYRANRRARSLTCRGRARPRRLGLSKVVDVVSNSNDALGTTLGFKSNGKYSAAALTAFGEDLTVHSPTPT